MCHNQLTHITCIWRGRKNSPRIRSLMRAMVRLIDTMLRKSGGVYEFIDDAECILRIQMKKANHDIEVGGEKILKGEPVLVIHLWNERMPNIPKEGANLEWALALR